MQTEIVYDQTAKHSGALIADVLSANSLYETCCCKYDTCISLTHFPALKPAQNTIYAEILLQQYYQFLQLSIG